MKWVNHQSCQIQSLKSRWCKNFDFWIVDPCRFVAWCSRRWWRWLLRNFSKFQLLFEGKKSSGLCVLKFFFSVFDNLDAPGLLRWSPEISTDASHHKDRKPENSVQAVTSCFFFFRRLCRPRMSMSSNSSEQAKISNIRKKFLQCLC